MDSCIQLFFWLVQTSRTLRVGGEPRCLSALLCIARIPDFKRVVLPGPLGAWGRRLWAVGLGIGGTLLECFSLLWKVLKLASEFGFLWVSSIFEDWHGLKKAIWGQWSKEPNSTLFVNTRYWLIWICWWLTSMRIWIWRRNWRRWRCFGCEEIGFATLNRVCRCPSAGIWLLTTIAKTKSQQVAFVLLMLHVSFDAQPNSNFLLKSRGNFMAVMGRSEMNISTRLLLYSALDVTWGKDFDSWNAQNHFFAQPNRPIIPNRSDFEVALAPFSAIAIDASDIFRLRVTCGLHWGAPCYLNWHVHPTNITMLCLLCAFWSTFCWDNFDRKFWGQTSHKLFFCKNTFIEQHN